MTVQKRNAELVRLLAADFVTRRELSTTAGNRVTLTNTDLTVSGGGALTLSAAGSYTLTVPATGTVALLGTANTFTEAQRVTATSAALYLQGGGVTSNTGIVASLDGTTGTKLVISTKRDGGATTEAARILANGHLLVNTTTDSAQVTIQAGSTSVLGLVVNVPSGSTASSAVFSQNGAGRVYILRNGSASEGIRLEEFDNGSGSGNVIYTKRNTNASTPAPGTMLFQRATAALSYLWPDDSGVWRTGSSAPTNAVYGSGTVVGTQTSTRDTKDIIRDGVAPETALATILHTPVYEFQYKNGAYNNSVFHGIVSEESPEFVMDEGRVFNPISAFGFTVQAIKSLYQRIEQLENTQQ